MKAKMELTSKRLLLRPWRKEDATSLFILASNPKVPRFMTWTAHKNVKESEDSIVGVLSAPENYAICLRKTGELIGNIALIRGSTPVLALTDFEASIGVWLGEPYWGKRYIEEAYKLVEDRAKALGIRKVYWYYQEENLASGKAAKRAGFKKENWMSSEKNNLQQEVKVVITSRTIG